MLNFYITSDILTLCFISILFPIIENWDFGDIWYDDVAVVSYFDAEMELFLHVLLVNV